MSAEPLIDRVVARITALVGGLSGKIAVVVSLAGCSGEFSALDPAGRSAREVAWLWWGMFGFATLVLLALIGVWWYAMSRHSKALSETQAESQYRRWLIGGGLVLPVAAIAVLLAFGIPVGHRMMPLPEKDGFALRIEVTGHQWHWEVRYPEGNIELRDEIHIPVDTPVDVHLTSADVVHSFWVPRLGGKLDLLPGRTNVLRLQADEEGTYRGQCAEFCGVGHAHMHFTVTVHAADDYAAWYDSARQAQESADE
ncbi:cytochrome c oxidase subunit II [Marinimicrobium sp. ARAG 43.8]|uniref:cytochrome c oxidase subunit II n=1 Tax=Marinimicrobium sp. ARAG 43.8 TaxID=3418719 RepID=UPI003CF9DC08